MRNLIIIINLSIIIGVTTILTRPDTASTYADNNAIAGAPIAYPEEMTAVKSEFHATPERGKNKTAVNGTAVEYLRELADGRLMNIEEGKMAQQRTTTRELKNYGASMVHDQEEMLTDIRKIAERKDISMPVWLSNNKADGLADLKRVHGKEFDKKFIRMMIMDHKRDVRLLEKATRSDDADLQVFATRYLPVVQSHLDKIKALKKKY